MSLTEQTQRNDRNREGQRALYGDARVEHLRVPPQALDPGHAGLGGLELGPRGGLLGVLTRVRSVAWLSRTGTGRCWWVRVSTRVGRGATSHSGQR